MSDLIYLRSYPDSIQQQVRQLLQQGKLGSILQQRYPTQQHPVQTDKALYDLTLQLKQRFMKSSEPLSKVLFDPKIHVINNALGTHTQISRVQGGKLKSKNEIRVASLLKQLPFPILNMVVVHELAHLKEKDHNKAFYQLCQYMEPQYHQLELDLRLFLTWRDINEGAQHG
jgi:predicted metal-dependent hydrolase